MHACVLDDFLCPYYGIDKRAQSDRPLALSIQHGMLRDRVKFSLDLYSLQGMITAM